MKDLLERLSSDTPKKIVSLLCKYEITEHISGRLDSDIYRLIESDGSRLFLKIATGNAAIEVSTEHNIIKILSQLFPVPKLIDFAETSSYTLIITEEIEGYPAHILNGHDTSKESVHVVGKALRQLHNISSGEKLSLPNGLDEELKQIDLALQKNLINVARFKEKNVGRTPSEIFNQLEREQQTHQTDCITHGDYCLPNVLRQGINLAGIIDWGKSGMSDRHRDFSAMEGSISRNFGAEIVPLFYKAYGVVPSDIERDKIIFYQKVDQFWYCLEANCI